MSALALEFPALTATRSGETLNAQWREFDLAAATWVIPGHRMTTNEAFSVPLSERVVAIITEARAHARKEPEPESYVFPGIRPKRPLSSMALNMLLRRMNVAVTPHGFEDLVQSLVLRCHSWGVRGCRTVPVASRRQRGVAGLQSHQMLERRRPIMAAWANDVTGEAADNVVPMTRAAQ